MSDAPKAVFLSYASQDAEAAKRIADALRAAGVEVWFDQSELVGGDAWDAKIRKQIVSCALFVPIISQNTQSRTEGYFRLEWRLADQRTHLMAKGRPFLLPVVIDDTRDAEAHVPDSFTEVQWTRLPDGAEGAVFAARVKELLSGDAGRDRRIPPASDVAGSVESALQTKRRSWPVPAVIGVVALVALAVWRPWHLPARSEAASPELTRIRQLADQGSASREDLALALTMARRLTAEQPANASGWAWQSVVQSMQNLRGYDVSAVALEEARRAAEHALSIDRQSADAALAMGLHLANMVSAGGDVAAAEAYLGRAASSTNPDLARIGLAILYREAWRLDDVARECEAVLQANPGHQLAAYYLGGVRAWQRRPEEAARLRGMAVSGGGLLGIRATVGSALAVFSAQGDLREVRRLLDSLEPAARLDARAVVAYWQAGYWERNGDLALRALGSLPDAYVFDSYFYGPKATLAGLAHRLAGRTEAARVQFEEAERVARERLGRDPADDMARLRVAQALALLGRGPEARRELQAVESAIAARPVSLGRVVQRGVIGRIYAELGDIEAMLPYVRDLLLEWNLPAYTPKAFAMDPDWDRVRDDPRVQAIVRQGGGGADTVPAGDKSVAVLAFANLSDDKANEYFSDGISEELLNVLAKVPGLKVSARTSAFYFKGKQVPLAEIAQHLGVAYVVEGSVRKQGDKVRITAQLIKAADGFHVWSDTFTRDLKDIFAVQDEIAGLIAKNLQLKLGAGDSARGSSTDLAAWQSYLDGRRAWNLRTMEGYREAETLLQRAIALDARFARAYAALADVWQLRAIDENAGVFSRQWRTLPTAVKSRALIDKALEIDPLCAEAYASLGMNLQLGWQDEPALQAFRQAIELNPNYATAHQWLGLALLGVGRMDETLSEVKQAAQLDPLSHRILSDYAKALNLSGNPAEALVMSRRALAIQPGAVQAVLQEARALAMLGRPLEAVALVEGTKKRDITERMWPETLAILAMARQPEAIRRLIGDVDAMPASTAKFASLVALGRIDEAFAQVESSIIEDGWSVVEAAYGQLFEPIRNDARFQQMIKTSGRAEYYARAQAWRAAHPPGKTEARKQ